MTSDALVWSRRPTWMAVLYALVILVIPATWLYYSVSCSGLAIGLGNADPFWQYFYLLVPFVPLILTIAIHRVRVLSDKEVHGKGGPSIEST